MRLPYFIHKKSEQVILVPILAADPGFEPGQNESESLVLPLHKSATSDNIIPLKIDIVKPFFEKN